MKRFELRLDDEIHRQLEEQAASQHRSLHGHITWIIEQTQAELARLRRIEAAARAVIDRCTMYSNNMPGEPCPEQERLREALAREEGAGG